MDNGRPEEQQGAWEFIKYFTSPDVQVDWSLKEYYCIRCQYTGKEEDVLAKNQMARFRYRFLEKRFTEDEFETF